MNVKFKAVTPVIYKELLVPDQDVEIDVTNLTDEFRYFPPLYYRYTMELSYAKEKLADANAGLKEIKARAYVRIKSEPGKPSEAYIDSMLTLDPHVQAQTKQVAVCDYEVRNFEGIIQAMKFKKDFLIQLGADARKEN